MEVLPARNALGQARKGGAPINPYGRKGGPRLRAERELAYELEQALQSCDGVRKLAQKLVDEAVNGEVGCPASIIIFDRLLPRIATPDEHENRADLELAERASTELIDEFTSRAREALPSGRAILDITAEPDPERAS